MTASGAISSKVGNPGVRDAPVPDTNATGLDRQLAAPGALARYGATPGSTYTVKPGDTLSAIARANGTTWQTLARINGIANPDRIHPDQTLRLPVRGGGGAYVVQPGDTLGRIAAAHGTSVSALARANGIANPDRIFAGQSLRMGGSPRAAETAPTAPQTRVEAGGAARTGAHRLGQLSEGYESGNRGPGTVSTGRNDPGGVSYGVYQLSSRAGTLQSFMRNEGARWAGETGTQPGSRAFSDAWRGIAAREPQAFRDAQHAFIQRTHYAPAVAAVTARSGLDLNGRADAVRDATWSVSVQHGGAETILNRAVAATDARLGRTDAGYDRALIGNIYAERTAYVLDVAANPKLSAGERAQLIGVTRNRYPAELADALRMLDGQGPAGVAREDTARTASSTIDGNAVARDNDVSVKSASVRMGRLDASMGPVIVAVAQAARELGLPRPVITSANDSRHGNDSLHYENRALDFRGNNISIADGQRLEARVNAILGPGYDVIFETFVNSSNNHLHVEHDPN